VANSKSKTKKVAKVPKQYPDYANLVGQAAKTIVDGDVIEGYVDVLGEYDDDGTPHTAVFKERRTANVLVVHPKDIELLGADGFTGGH
jgi:hypothetical protein